MKNTLKPKALQPGSTIGVFTPSFPAHTLFREKYLYGIQCLKDLGFDVVEGALTRSLKSQGYRTAGPKERAQEFMELIQDPKVDALMSGIGGYNSASLIPYLDFAKIRESRKVICGYSDVSSLHMAILRYAGLRTFYGPAVMPSFGEYPKPLSYTVQNFLQAVSETENYPRKILPPEEWSRHFRDAKTDEWKTIPREFQKNAGWKVLNSGEASGEVVVLNLNTMMSNAGTKHFPDFTNKILITETATGDMATEERLWRHFDLVGGFDQISGLVVGKPENFHNLEAPFSQDDLILEVASKRNYPILSEFDCSHTVPMLTLAELAPVKIQAYENSDVFFEISEAMVEK